MLKMFIASFEHNQQINAVISHFAYSFACAGSFLSSHSSPDSQKKFLTKSSCAYIVSVVLELMMKDSSDCSNEWTEPHAF